LTRFFLDQSIGIVETELFFLSIDRYWRDQFQFSFLSSMQIVGVTGKVFI